MGHRIRSRRSDSWKFKDSDASARLHLPLHTNLYPSHEVNSQIFFFYSFLLCGYAFQNSGFSVIRKTHESNTIIEDKKK